MTVAPARPERRHLVAEAVSMRRSLGRAWRRLGSGSGRLAVLAVVGSVLRSLLVVPFAFLLRRLLDHALPQKDISALVAGAAVLLTLFAAGSLVSYLTRRAVLRLTQEALERVRLHLLDKLYALPRTFFNTVDDSDVQSLVIQDSGRLEAVLSSTVSTVLPALVVGVAVAVVALFLQPALFALVLVTMPVSIVVSRIVLRRVHARTLRWQRTVDDYSADVTRALRAMTLTHVVGARDVEVERQSRTIRRLREDAFDLANAQASARGWLGTSTALGGALLLTVGAIEVSRGSISAGTLLSFYAVIAVLSRQVGTVLGALPALAAAGASYERIEALLERSDPPAYQGTQQHEFQGELELRGLSFGYDGHPLLRDVSLHLRPGEHVALLGPNGAGKSTLAMLVLGLYRPDEGALLLDGIPYDALDLSCLHRRAGVVLQDPVVLPGSIRDAVAYGRPGVTDEQVAQAARLVGLHEFVTTLEDGYATRVGDEGARLSGGQRQRLALARALVARPTLLVLDEPTNHLDDPSVTALLEALAALDPRPTILTITHDLLVAAAADRVLHVRDGTLRAQQPAG